MKNETKSALPNGDVADEAWPMYDGGRPASSVPDAIASAVHPSSCTRCSAEVSIACRRCLILWLEVDDEVEDRLRWCTVSRPRSHPDNI